MSDNKDFAKESKALDDAALEDVNGGLELTIGLPNATEENKKKLSKTVFKGKKKKASDLILREDSIKIDGPRPC